MNYLRSNLHSMDYCQSPLIGTPLDSSVPIPALKHGPACAVAHRSEGVRRSHESTDC